MNPPPHGSTSSRKSKDGGARGGPRGTERRVQPRETREVRVGCAGWAIPSPVKERFGDDGSALTRYAHALAAVEINTTFYRFHEPATFARWAASVPKHFRFSVKLSREITHLRKLAECDEPLERFFVGVKELGARLGPVLIQLPPSLGYEDGLVRGFLHKLRVLHEGAVALEPRHPSWFGAAAGRALVEHRIARVAADPAITPASAEPGGADEIVYHRLHGTPQMYYSSYPRPFLVGLAERLLADSRSTPAWVIFDNTAAGAAAANALALVALLSRTRRPVQAAAARRRDPVQRRRGV